MVMIFPASVYSDMNEEVLQYHDPSYLNDFADDPLAASGGHYFDPVRFVADAPGCRRGAAKAATDMTCVT
jgi:hypothetical protein